MPYESRSHRMGHSCNYEETVQEARPGVQAIQLYELQARRADAKVGKADLDIGRVGFSVRHSGYFVYPSPSLTIQRYGSMSHKHHHRRHDTLTIHLD